jgi:hypothetical protein
VGDADHTDGIVDRRRRAGYVGAVAFRVVR